MQYSETMMRQAIAQVPDGVYSAEGYFDGFAEDPDEAKRDIKIRVRSRSKTVTYSWTLLAPRPRSTTAR